MTGQRRRRDDWKTDSGHSLNRRWFYEIVTRLGYEPSDVVSVRMNEHEVIVVSQTPLEMKAVRHALTVDE